MNIIEAIRQRILKFLGIEKLDENPNGERLNFISDDDNIKSQKLRENKIWYIGDSDELLNYYTNKDIFGNNEEPIYNRNKRGYFWGISAEEGNIKRVHSGVPNAIVTTLVNAIGNPSISSKDEGIKNALSDIIEKTDFMTILNQQQMPLTMVEGWGAFKPTFDKELSDVPLIQYYEAEDVEFVYKSGVLIGIIYKDYYKYNNKDYVLLETRRRAKGNSIIEYQLFRDEGKNSITPVPLTTIPELAQFEGKTITIPNYNKVLGVPTKFFFDTLNKNYGRSIFTGKIDLFDDLDQILSQDSQSVRVSTPVEYYPVDVLERDSSGNPKMPKIYNRQYIKKEGIPNGDGTMDGSIQTTQPQLNFDQYNTDAKAKLDFILTGLLSPATMGIDIAKKDNADAQREKEKVTIMTRGNIIEREGKILRDLFSMLLDLKQYMDSGVIQMQDYDISVKFDEFANPSFENEIQVLGSAWANGELSTKKYVELLWGDKLSDEEREEEIQWLDSNKQSDNLDFGDLDGTEGTFGTGISNEREEETTNNEVEE